jgi:hypothetical protein
MAHSYQLGGRPTSASEPLEVAMGSFSSNKRGLILAVLYALVDFDMLEFYRFAGKSRYSIWCPGSSSPLLARSSYWAAD